MSCRSIGVHSLFCKTNISLSDGRILTRTVKSCKDPRGNTTMTVHGDPMKETERAPSTADIFKFLKAEKEETMAAVSEADADVGSAGADGAHADAADGIDAKPVNGKPFNGL